MLVNDYEKFVREGASSNYTDLTAYIALVEEVGEVGGVIKKSTIYNTFDFFKKYGMSKKEKLLDELGDVLWQYVNLLNVNNIKLEEVIDYNVNKLNKRYKGEKFKEDGGER